MSSEFTFLDALIFHRDAIQYDRVWSSYVVPVVLRLEGAKRSEQKAQAQQAIDFFQEADDGLGLRHEAIDCFEVTREQALIARQERDGNIRFGILHPHCGHTTIHFGHAVVEE